MTERTVCLSDWQVRAWLDKRLSVLFVPMKPQPRLRDELIDHKNTLGCPASEGFVWAGFKYPLCESKVYHKSPFSPGDTLLGKEAWGIDPNDWGEWWAMAYKTDFAPDHRYHWGWNSPVTMPREAVRIKMPVVSVGAVRVGDVTLDDARRAGIAGYTFARGCISDDPPDPRWKLIEYWNGKYSRYPWDTAWAWRLEVGG